MIVLPEMFDKLRQEWAQPNDAVFHLTPPIFHAQVNAHYTSLGRPAISPGNFWDIYIKLVDCFHASPSDPTLIRRDFELANLGADDEMEIMPGLRELRNLDDVVGDMAIAGDYEAEFTDSGMDDDGDVLINDAGYYDDVCADFTDSGAEE